jgi:imidazolonepropionase-like amidohydrolase
MGQTLFTNVRIFDGSGKKLFPGEVLIQGNRIQKVAKNKSKITAEGAKVVDGGGATLMPGLTEAHMHMSYTDCAQLKEIGEVPPEEHTLLTALNAEKMLSLGFTSTFSAAGSKPRLDIAVRNYINEGKIPGPRMRVASPEITSTGGLGDERQLHMHHHSIELIVDGPVEMSRTCRLMVREGVDTLKINISGDQFCMDSVNAEMMSLTDEEIAAAAEVGHARQVNLACHARSSDSVKAALKHGFNVIYHADFCDEEALDLLEAAKDKIFLAPAVGVVYTTAYEAADWGITTEVAQAMGMFRKLEYTERTYREARKRGLRVLPGGDYGFAWNPIGTNARDFEHFVNMFGYTPAETLKAATKLGGEIMGMGDELGLVKQGYLADLIMVDGDPLEDISLFQDQDNFLMIMKNGEYHKEPSVRRAGRRRKKAA